jgi:hypothetical protein
MDAQTHNLLKATTVLTYQGPSALTDDQLDALLRGLPRATEGRDFFDEQDRACFAEWRQAAIYERGRRQVARVDEIEAVAA